MGFDWSTVDGGDIEIYKELKVLAIANGHGDDLAKGYSPLYVAIHFGKSGELKKLFEQVPDIDVNKVEPNLAKPIFFAVEANSPEAFLTLIDKGADFENIGMLRCNKNSKESVVAPVPLLAVCCYQNRPEMADLLLRNCRDRVNIDQTHTHENRTALYAAASCGHLAVAEVLMKHKADPTIASNILDNSFLPIEKAIIKDDLDMTVALHNYAPDLTYRRGPAGIYSPAELALSMGRNSIFERISRADIADLEPVKSPEDVTMEDMEREFDDYEAARAGSAAISEAVANRVSGAAVLDHVARSVRM